MLNIIPSDLGIKKNCYLPQGDYSLVIAHLPLLQASIITEENFLSHVSKTSEFILSSNM